MFSLSKLVVKRLRIGLRVAAPTRYNSLQTNHTTSNIFTIESVLSQRTCQEIIWHIEKHFVEKKLVPQPNQVHYNSYLLCRILDERDAENRKVREALADLNKAALGFDEENTSEKLEQVIDFINCFSDKGKSREDIISGLPLAPSVFVKEFFHTVARVAKHCILAEGVDNPQFQKRIIKIANSMSKVLCFITCRKPEDYQFITFESAAAMVAMAILCPMTLAITLIQPKNLLSDFYNSLTTTLSKPGAGYELYNQDWWWVFLDSLYGRQSEDHVREAIQREIEKEQIRQEIIASETTRRRELIAEVVQEMAIEREMAIRRVTETKGTSLDKKLTMLINQRKLPIQNHNNDLFRQKCSYNESLMHTGPCSLATTSPMIQLPQLQKMNEVANTKETSIMESNKEKLIVLNRADPIGPKHTETGLERGKRKADGVEKGLNETLESKRLKSEEGDLEEGEIASPRKRGSGKEVETVVASKPKRKFKFWCDVCSVGAYNETVMRNHKLGKKHITNSEKVMENHKLGKKHKAQLKKQYSEQVMMETQKA